MAMHYLAACFVLWSISAAVSSRSVPPTQRVVPEPESDLPTLISKIACREKDRQMMECALENHCARFLERETVLQREAENHEKHVLCLENCQQQTQTRECHSLILENFDQMAVECFETTCGDSPDCMFPCMVELAANITDTQVTPELS